MVSYVHVNVSIAFAFVSFCDVRSDDEHAGAIVAKRACPLLCHDCKHQLNYIFSPSELEFVFCWDLLCFLVLHMLIVVQNRLDAYIRVISISTVYDPIIYAMYMYKCSSCCPYHSQHVDLRCL